MNPQGRKHFRHFRHFREAREVKFTSASAPRGGKWEVIWEVILVAQGVIENTLLPINQPELKAPFLAYSKDRRPAPWKVLS
jgi:hypothetical protein